MKTPSQIIDFVSEDAVCAAFGVQRKAIREAIRRGKLPAMWYDTLEQMAGRPLAREAFSFKGDPSRKAKSDDTK